jgi:hypothetical protein
LGVVKVFGTIGGEKKSMHWTGLGLIETSLAQYNFSMPMALDSEALRQFSLA